MGKVFIFGAGASKALNHSAPLMNDLSSEVFDLARSRTNRDLIELQEFMEELYPHLSAKGWLPIQDLLSLLDSLILDKKDLSLKYDLDRLIKIRDGLLYAMLRVIQEKLRDNWATAAGIERFVTTDGYLGSFWENLADGDSLISLNYDLIFDNSLRHAIQENRVLSQPLMPPQNPNQISPLKSIDYGFQARFVHGPHRQTKEKYHGDKRIQLLKLHGSLNWLYCPKCQEIDVTEGAKGTIVNIYESKDTCPQCGERYQSVIITPTLLKAYENPKILKVWDVAEKMLQNADKVIFVGYSLPDADIILRTMFTKSFYTNRVSLSKRNLTIEVVDYVEELKRIPKENRDTYDRYYRNFGSITYDWTGFSEYIERGCITKSVSFPSP